MRRFTDAHGLFSQCLVIHNGGKQRNMCQKASVIGVFYLAVLTVVATACDEQALLDAEVAETPDDIDPLTETRALGCAKVYIDASFNGISLQIANGARVSFIGNQWNDQVSAVKVSPGCALNVWIDASYEGAHKTVAGYVPWIGSDWNDQISAWTCDCA
jgi:hypothetical protein